MKHPYFLSLVVLVLIWTVGEAAYRSGYKAGQISQLEAYRVEPPLPPPPAVPVKAVPTPGGMHVGFSEEQLAYWKTHPRHQQPVRSGSTTFTGVSPAELPLFCKRHAGTS
ncbi:MAG: hypothetical protein QM758_05995 [Armatimonas sp.]